MSESIERLRELLAKAEEANARADQAIGTDASRVEWRLAAEADQELNNAALAHLPDLLTRLTSQEAELGRLREDAGLWRWTSERAWFVDAAAHAFDLAGTRWEPKDYDADDIKDAIKAAMAEDGNVALGIDSECMGDDGEFTGWANIDAARAATREGE